MEKEMIKKLVKDIANGKYGDAVNGIANVNGFAVDFAHWTRSSDGMEYINIPVYDNGERKVVCIPVQGYEQFIDYYF